MSRLTSLFISWNTIRRIVVIGSVVGRDNRRRILLPLPSSSPPLFLFFVRCWSNSYNIIFLSHPCSLLDQHLQHHHSSTTFRIIHRNQFHNSQFSSYSTYSSSLPTSLDANRYQRFRYSLQLLSQSSSQQQQQQQQLNSDNSKNHLITVGKHVMKISSSNRRSFNRTWKRLGPLLELIVASTSTTTTTTTLSLSSSNENRKLYSIADVGCDHGILSMSLACMAHVSSSQQRLQEQQLPHNNDSIIDGTANDNSSNNYNNNNFFFNRVYGIDLSSKALDDGAMQTLKKIINAITWSSSSSTAEYHYINSKSNNENNNNNNNTELLPIEFRIGNGLEALHIGEADAIVLAGMGVETMMEILFLDTDGRRRRSGKDTVITPPIDRVQTNHIYLQPTNSRPQQMMKLYDRIQQTGEWILGNESIAYSSGRWYINSLFERRQRQQLQQQSQQSNNDDGDEDGDGRFRFPGHFLEKQDSMKNDNENVYGSYIKHHLQWLKDDCERTPKYVIEDEDRRWIEYITSNKRIM